MIITVTLNPAVDKTIILDRLQVGNVNRIQQIREDAGGKGINVSKMIRNLNGETLATGFLGGNTGAFIRAELDKMGITHDFVEIDGNTRTNFKIVDTQNQAYTDINGSGEALPQYALEQLENKMYGRMMESDVIIFSGSIPQNVDKSIYAKWITKAKLKGVKTVLDADGDMLREGITAGPYMIKPNIHELERLLDKKLENVDDVIRASKCLLDYGIRIIAVSMGEQGSVFVTKENIIIAEALKVDVKSTVGAGDSMVGALAYGISHNMALEDAITLAIAAASASISNEGTMMGSLEQINYWKEQVKIKSVVD
ncbi:MAG: 1-phosphofructokinase [Bacillota bacterium]